MTVGHAPFAAASTGYILVAPLAFEERGLERFSGEPYRRHRRKVPAFLPHLGREVREEEFAPAHAVAIPDGHVRTND